VDSVDVDIREDVVDANTDVEGVGSVALAELLVVAPEVRLVDEVVISDDCNDASDVAVVEDAVVLGAITGAVKAGLTVVVCSTTEEHRLPAIAPITTWAQSPDDGAGKPAKRTPPHS
jgi:hypothetical protein